ncbi:hypothetical protein HK097_004812, partial [Rhizophlyctis rosea]
PLRSPLRTPRQIPPTTSPDAPADPQSDAHEPAPIVVRLKVPQLRRSTRIPIIMAKKEEKQRRKALSLELEEALLRAKAARRKVKKVVGSVMLRNVGAGVVAPDGLALAGAAE